MSLRIYTDGACSGNPGPGGWGVVIYSNTPDPKVISGHKDHSTNNEMELTAVYQALLHLTGNIPATIYTDSRYVVDGINTWIQGWKRNGWYNSKREPVKNGDLWRKLDSVLQELRQTTTVTIEWVRGHNGDPGNELADRIACMARDKIPMGKAVTTAASFTVANAATLTANIIPSGGAMQIRNNGHGEYLICNGRKLARQTEHGVELLPLAVSEFRCQLPLSQGVDEPGLAHIIRHYYQTHGLDQNTAEITTMEYLEQLRAFSVARNT